MYDSARDCFTEQQQEQRAAEQAAEQARQEAAARDENTPRRRISTVGDLLSPVEDTKDAKKKPPTHAGSPGMSSATLSPEDTQRPKAAAPAASPAGKRKRERTPSGTADDRKRHAPDSRDRAHHDERPRERREREPGGERRDRRDREDGRRRGGPAPPPSERNPYAPRRRSRSPQATTQRYQRRQTSPSQRYRYRSPPPPLIPKRDPSPLPLEPRSRDASPPRQRKRPGAAARMTDAEKAANLEKMRQADLEAERKAKESISSRGNEEVVRAHYNEKKELGKTWRKTDSRIKGLRSFNNWIKSTIIQKFSPNDSFDPRSPPFPNAPDARIRVLDMGCGKGGDLLKWKNAPQEVDLYVGVDTADVSIAQAKERFDKMVRETRQRGRNNNRPTRIFDAEFHVMDCWSNWVGEIPIVSHIGADPNVGPGQAGRISARWGGGGFDVVTMMFCMHYAFESEVRCRTMLRNVAGALKKGGRFIGTIPSSDVISARVQGKFLPPDEKAALDAAGTHGVQEWGNSIYRVKFAEQTPLAGTFRPPWGWRYNFFLEEAVEEVPEYVVPWEAFRAIAEDYNLELIYKKPFHDIWREEKDDRDMKVLSERMGVTDREGRFALGDEEWEGCGFYLGFAFKKT